MCAIGRHAIIPVDQVLVVALLERPQHALHERRVHGLVGAVIIDPPRHVRNIVPPGFIVVGDDFPAGVIERGDAQLVLYHMLALDTKLNLRLILDRQAMAIPSPNTRHGIAPHGPIPGNHVLDEGNQHRAMMGFSRGKGRSVIKYDLATGLALHRLFEQLMLTPEPEDVGLCLRDIGLACQFFVLHVRLLRWLLMATYGCW